MTRSRRSAREPHDGAWIYVSLPQRGALEDAVVDTCRRHGWPVLRSTDESIQRSSAIAHADACIFDLSRTMEAADPEIAVARDSGRPMILLSGGSPVEGDRASAIFEHASARVVAYRAVDDCVVTIDAVLGDVRWQRLIATAAPDE